ncbi:MAG: poly-gamma-glutamate hydrolase family protein, partial [Acidimicrobiales bacterium]
VVDPDLNDKDARDAGELVERLDDDGAQTHLIVIAPHGGAIEKHTDGQADRVRKRLGPQLASAWRAKGWGSDGGAFVRWHITSTDLNPVCFPLLDSVMSRRFDHAVAFHGFNDEPGVLIGGTAPAELKERLSQAIRQVLPAGLDVRVALPTDRYGGDDPDNIVNRLSPCGGIQIEQGATPRDDHGCDIADVVADFFRPARAPRESWARRRIEGVLARAWEAAQSLLDRLRGRQREGSE